MRSISEHKPQEEQAHGNSIERQPILNTSEQPSKPCAFHKPSQLAKPQECVHAKTTAQRKKTQYSVDISPQMHLQAYTHSHTTQLKFTAIHPGSPKTDLRVEQPHSLAESWPVGLYLLNTLSHGTPINAQLSL